MISPANTSDGICVKLTWSAGAGGNIVKFSFLSNCGGLSAADGPSADPNKQ